MADSPNRGPFQWIFETTLLILGAALAVNMAVWLIAEVWVDIAIVGVITAVVAGFIFWWRLRGNRW